MENIKNEDLRQMLAELSERLFQVYGEKLKEVILYGSVARGGQTSDSDIDIMVLIDGTDQELRQASDKLCDVSTDMALKYLRVFSIIDISYREFSEWSQVVPFYRNVSNEGIVLYAA